MRLDFLGGGFDITATHYCMPELTQPVVSFLFHAVFHFISVQLFNPTTVTQWLNYSQICVRLPINHLGAVAALNHAKREQSRSSLRISPIKVAGMGRSGRNH